MIVSVYNPDYDEVLRRILRSKPLRPGKRVPQPPGNNRLALRNPSLVLFQRLAFHAQAYLDL
jgi:hypothetical protein